MAICSLRCLAFTVLAALLGNGMCTAQTKGLENGWLILDGSGKTVSRAATQRFVALAGGTDANIAFIPTAMSDDEMQEGHFDVGEGKGLLQRWGINPAHVTMLHARDKDRANSDFFLQTLRKASGVVICCGGQPWRLADAYLDTAVERGIKELLGRGGVVYANSAGATVLGSYLVRGDPKAETVMMSPGHEKGFGFLSDTAIDVKTKEREHDLVPVIKQHPKLLGIGIDEGAWILVHGDSLSVFGGQVVLYDPARYGADFYHFLSPGEKFSFGCVHVKGAC